MALNTVKRRPGPLPDTPLPEPVSPRSLLVPIGVVVWGLTAVVCVAIAQRWAPWDGWIDQERWEPPAAPAAKPTLARRPQPTAPALPEISSLPPPAGSAPAPSTRPVSCEGALAAHRSRVMSGLGGGPPGISEGRFRDAIGAGSHFEACALPSEMRVVICAAIQGGRAAGVTVDSTPPDARVRRCVADAVRAMDFADEPGLDVSHAQFEAL